MPNLKYKGPADVREIAAADFKANGLDGQQKVKFDASNGFTAEVSDEAAELLIGLEPNRFSIVEKATDETSLAESIESSKQGTTKGAPAEGANTGTTTATAGTTR